MPGDNPGEIYEIRDLLIGELFIKDSCVSKVIIGLLLFSNF